MMSTTIQEFPDTADFLEDLGADTSLGLAGTVQERLRDVSLEEALAQQQQRD